MSHYAVGDIQGCYQELTKVLEQVAFKPSQDYLWVVGDIVNRGPNSLAALEYLYNHRHCVYCVLGNHDLHLLAIYYGVRKAKRSDTFDEILAAPQCDQWMQWLTTLPLCHYDKQQNYAMVHAGIAPQWTLEQALQLSTEVETVLQSNQIKEFLSHMYGDTPSQWNDKLQGLDRLRCITNHFTRMRIISNDGELELSYKGDLNNIPKGCHAWFDSPQRNMQTQRILFGHWASLGGYTNNKTLYGLDTGCVWGGDLTLMNLKTNELTLAQAQH